MPKKSRSKPSTLSPTRGPAGHRHARRREAERKKIAARRRVAYRMYFDEDRKLEDIAEATKVSIFTASMDVRLARDAAMAADADRLVLDRERQAARLERLIAGSMAQALARGKLKSQGAAGVALNAMARESRLLGLDARREDTFSSEQVAGLLRGITQLFVEVVQDERLRREFALGLRRKVGTIAAPIDTTSSDRPAPLGPRPLPAAGSSGE